MEWAFVVAGAGVGFVVGLTGVGGGALMTPLLILGFGIAPAIAVGTDLIYAAITKLAGVAVHARQQCVQWAIVGRLALGSLPGAALALWLLKDLAPSGGHEALIHHALGIGLVATAAMIFLRGRWPIKATLPPVWQVRLTVLSGFLLGVLVTLTSVGAGAIGAALIGLIYPRLETARIVGTDLAHAVPLAALAGLGHWQLGGVDTALLGALLCGSIPGIILGARAGLRLPEALVRNALGVMLLFVGVRMAL